MRFIATERSDLRELHYHVVIPKSEVLGCQLYPLDFKLIDECSHSGSVADKLLALELIARRIEEACATKSGNKVS